MIALKIKKKWKHQTYKIYKKNGQKDSDYFKLREVTGVVSELLVDIRKNIKIT